ncbi:uncharacterized protein L199_004868 [Kwoniella botswanensis]|uniref:uncharacterized protein n=1 Tax=Kwoniella botswanensis TaxID=1268659 RepID=UPI00315CAA7C
MSQPPPSAPAGPSTPGGTVRPSAPGQSLMTINTIMHNLPNLFEMQSQGRLTDVQIVQLRQLMHTHFRQVIASSMASGRPNPLLNLPEALDPTMPFDGRPPLISKEAYSASIATTTQHLKEAMAQRAKDVAAQNQNQNQSQISQPSMNTPPTTQPQPQSQSQTQNNAIPSVPLPPQPQRSQQQALQSTLQPISTSGPSARPVAPNVIPNQIPQGAVTSAGMAKINSNPTSVPSPASAAASTTAPAAAGQNTGTSTAIKSQPNKVPNGILAYSTMRELMKLTPEQRTTWLRADPQRTSAFNLSAKYWTSRTNANAAANANANANVNANAAASSSTSQSSQATQRPTTIAPSALLTPPIPPQTNAVPPPTNPKPIPQQNVPPSTTTLGDTSKSDPSQTAPATAPAPSKEETKNPPSTEDNTKPATTNDDKTATVKDSDEAPKAPVGAVADPALPSAIANPQAGSEVPAFASALPDLKTFALKPPPPPPEPENVRRKRKCKEFIGELHPGMEMEYGMDEVIGDILDGLLDEGLKGATRLAKHRKSDKVELKDIAFFVDQCWGIETPGFDALGHTHRKTHIPPERERRRGRAVNPRAARLGQGRARDEE